MAPVIIAAPKKMTGKKMGGNALGILNIVMG